jgi:hypothetical protein
MSTGAWLVWRQTQLRLSGSWMPAKASMFCRTRGSRQFKKIHNMRAFQRDQLLWAFLGIGFQQLWRRSDLSADSQYHKSLAASLQPG